MKKHVLIIMTLLLMNSCLAFAAEPYFQLSAEAEKEAETEVKLKGWLEKFQNLRKSWEDKYGTTFSVLINSQSQTPVHSKVHEGKWSPAWYYNVGLQQRLWKGASGIFEIEGGHNLGIDKRLPSFSILNYNAWEVSYLYVSRLYLEQNIFQDKLYLAAGRVILYDWFDDNAVAAISDTQFQAGPLNNNPTIPFPLKGLGAVAEVKPADWVYFQVGAADAEAVPTRVGVSNCFEGTLFIAETGLSPKIGGLQGNYRFIFHLDHEGLERIDGLARKVDNPGFALSFDQQITKRITLFLRYGFADRQVCDIEHFWSVGGQITELIPGRKDDVFGVGVAQSIVGEPSRITNESGRAETLYEVYYNISLHPFVKLIPNIEVVTHPLAEKENGTYVITGCRLVIIF